MDSEQTTDRTFRVTITPEGRTGVSIFVDGAPSVVLWLGSEDHRAAERLPFTWKLRLIGCRVPAFSRRRT